MINRILLVLLLLAAQYQLLAQVTTAQLMLKDTTASILYRGIDNTVAIKNLPPGTRIMFNGQPITPATGAMEGRPVNEQRFLLRPPGARACTLQVFVGAKQIFNTVFQVRSVDEDGWRIRVGTSKDTFTTVSQILAAPYVFTDYGTSYLKRKYQFNITHYKLTVISRGTVVLERVKSDKKGLDGQEFDAETKAYIKKLVKGDQLMLEEIRAYPVEGITRSPSDCKWTIK